MSGNRDDNMTLVKSYPIERIRAQFPALQQESNGKHWTYLDNPGGTQVPRRVIDAISRCLVESNANLGGAFATTVAAGQLVDEAHKAMADFVNAHSPDEIIFGQNMTSLTFHMSRSIGKMMSAGDEIILTCMEHDANVTPWELLAHDMGLEIKRLPFNRDSFEFELDQLSALVSDRTRLVCFNHASNMTGTINDVKAVSEIAHRVGALVYVDSVQFAPHGAIDVQDLGCDFLVCSAYKFFGPHISMLWGREELLKELEPYKLRAAGDGLPDRFEIGTLSHEAMAGATAAINYFDWIGTELTPEHHHQAWQHLEGRRRSIHAAMDYLFEYEKALTERMIDGLQAIKGLTVQGITDPEAMDRRVPTISFTMEGWDPADIAQRLAGENIFVWSGHNYAIEPAKWLGIYDRGSVLRIGLAHYNSLEEVDRTVRMLEDILK